MSVQCVHPRARIVGADEQAKVLHLVCKDCGAKFDGQFPDRLREAWKRNENLIRGEENMFRNKYEQEKNANQELADQLETAASELTKAAGEINRLLAANKQLAARLAEAAGHPPQPVPAGREGAEEQRAVTLEHTETVYTVVHTTKRVSVTTGTVNGRILFIAVTKFPTSEFTMAELSAHLLEYGWNISNNTLSPSLGGLVRDGYLIRLPTKPNKYRLPEHVTITATQEDEHG